MDAIYVHYTLYHRSDIMPYMKIDKPLADYLWNGTHHNIMYIKANS